MANNETAMNAADANRNLDRVMAILDALAHASDQGLRLADVTRATGLNKTTAHRLLANLLAHGLVDQQVDTGRFFVGMRFLSLAQVAKKRFSFAPLVAPVLVRLCQQTQDTIYLIARAGDEAVCVDCQEGSFPIRVLTLYPGDRRPLGIGAGSLALLAFLPDHEVERILREQAAARSAFPFDDIQLRQMIAAARHNGYAYNDVHVFKGMDKMTNMAAVGVPVRSSGGTPVAALHLTAITQRVEPPRCDYIVATLRREADAIEAAYRPVLDAMEPQSASAGSSQPAAIKAADANFKALRPARKSCRG
jgi:DNA-binding IclR family transcriptional regulator